MGTFSSGVGLVSGFDYTSFIDQMMFLEAAGKRRLEDKVLKLQSQQTAMMDVNARLLNVKNATNAFRLDSIFRSSLATTSNEDILGATASPSAQPGSYTFIVKQLVANSQKMSRGYATQDASPLGMASMSFEFGKGSVASDTALEELNTGNGVARGRITITDRSGSQATIDLTDVTSLNEVLDRINDETSIGISATVQGDALVITDTTNGTGSLTVADATGYTTATDLGIAGTTAGSFLTGTNVNSIGLNTALSSLNDGSGVLILDNTHDFSIQSRDGRWFDIDLGRVDQNMDTETLLSDLNNGDGVAIDEDEETADIAFVDRSGTQHDVDLTGITTLGQLISRVDQETGGAIEIEIFEGDKIRVIDHVGGFGNVVKVMGAGPNGDDAAEDLGILGEADAGTPNALVGEIIPALIDSPRATTIGDVIDRINNAIDRTDVDNGGAIVASISDDGKGIKISDTTGSVLTSLKVRTNSGVNDQAAHDLGIAMTDNVTDYNGRALVSSLNSVFVASLNGGRGLDETALGLGDLDLSITDRAGQTYTITDLDTFSTSSLSDIVDHINQEATDNSLSITASINSNGTGLQITDTSGAAAGNLVISGGGATALGIAADVAEDAFIGSNLQLQYVSEATKLEDLNYGQGIDTGAFKITDGFGDTATVTIGGDEQTLYDVIKEINSRGLAVSARINDNGDGLIIEEDLANGGRTGETAFVTMKVESSGGTTAADLNILGESTDVIGGFIDGSYEQTVEFEASDSLVDVAEKLNDAGVGVTATIINTGSGATPYRLNISSAISGSAGEMIIDSVGADLGLSTLTEGRDAKIFFGSDDPETAFLITSSTNSIENVVNGVTLDLKKASDEAVTINIERDEQGIIDAVSQLVTTFNDAVGRIDDYDFFDIDTEERGVLLGDPAVAAVRNALFQLIQGKADNVDTQYTRLYQVGISVGSNGQLEFNQEEFQEAFDADPEAVENLFAAYKATAATDEEIAPGVTVVNSDTNVTARGFAYLFYDLMESLTNSIDGRMTLADNNITDLIDLNNNRIEAFDLRLESKRSRYEDQFIQMERAIADLQGQNGALSSMNSNVAMAQSLYA